MSNSAAPIHIALVLLLALATASILMVGCANPAPTSTLTPAVVASPSPALGERPPVITANYADQRQRGALGSYCWNGCADTLFFIPVQPITVPPGARIQFQISERFPPGELLVTLFEVGESQHLPWSDPSTLAIGKRSEIARNFVAPATQTEFQMPGRPGDYAVSLWGQWPTGPDYGPDAYYGFHIAVSD